MCVIIILKTYIAQIQLNFAKRCTIIHSEPEDEKEGIEGRKSHIQFVLTFNNIQPYLSVHPTLCRQVTSATRNKITKSLDLEKGGKKKIGQLMRAVV